MLSISLLGPVTVTRDSDLLRIPAGKPTELLARLALEPGVTIRSERLVDELWADAASTTRPNTLQSKVAALRRALGASEFVVGSAGGYRLAVEHRQVDALVALDAAASARLLMNEGEHRSVVAVCTSNLARFAGELLVGAGHEPWVEPYRARLEAARLELMEMCCSARLQVGESEVVVADLEPYVAAHPFHERLWSLLITALYQSGRQADALAAYQRARTLLAEELGLEPGPELRDVERQVLDQDARLAVPAVGDLVAGNLPALAVRLVGRDTDVSHVVELIRGHRLVEIVGPGGVGKTALALAVGRQLADQGGVWLVRLEAATNRAEVVDATVAALRVAGGEAALIERLRIAPTVLVIDNCEHVLADAADWVAELLDAAPDVRVLCTSQAPVGVAGSCEFALTPLGLDDAVTLFGERSTGHRRSGDLADGVRALCRALDGLPLAIELAAARTRTLSVAEINDRLDDRFKLLNDPTSHRPERRRALRATIAWSYELLFPDDQRGLWALATFAGGASLAGVEHVLGALGVPPAAAIDVIDRLVARSLIVVDHNTAATRYRLLDSIRAFALDALDEAGLAEVGHGANARWFIDAALASTTGVRSARQAEFLAFADNERANIDAALTWCGQRDPHAALIMAKGFGWAWVVLGDSRGAERIHTALDAAGGSTDAMERAEALLLIGWIEASTGHLEPARLHVVAAAELADASGDVELRARSAYYLAYVVSHHGDFREGLALTEKSRDLYAELDRPWDLAANGLFMTRAAISAADEQRSVTAARDVQRWLAAVADPWLHVRGTAMLGELARLQHRFAEAVTYIGEAADTSYRLGFRQTNAYQVASLGRAQCQAGDYETGIESLMTSVHRAEAIGDVRMAALARVHLGRVLRAVGRLDEAREVLEQTVEWHHRAGGGEQSLLGECLLCAIDSDAGDVAARHRLDQICAAGREADDAPVEVFALDALARCAVLDGDAETAIELLERADARMRVASHFITEHDRVDAAATRDVLPAGDRQASSSANLAR